MNREPETYDELILQKKCIELTKYYNLTMEQLEEIYEFLKKNKKGNIQGNTNQLLLNLGRTTTTTIPTVTISHIDGVIVNRKQFTVIPHYEPSSHSYSSGGSSSNNNNDNNNNNNNNR